MSDSPLIRIYPLGGLGEVGMNMLAMECQGDVIVIDCGQRMPGEDTPGIDMIIPDITELENIEGKIRGIVITHGHEDHVGALPHLWPTLRAPVYGRRLTLAMLRAKLREYDLEGTVPLREVKVREEIDLGAFGVTFVNVTHSIAQASALIIRTPVGTVVHSGDYKIDRSPVCEEEQFDSESLRHAGDEGVLLFLGDSTNVERPGRTVSESDLRPRFEELIGGVEGTVVIGCFSSSTHRHQLICDVAAKFDKRVFLAGASIARTVRIARELGLLKLEADIIDDLSDYASTRRSRRVVIAAGTQGEPFSALTRIALDEHKQVHLQPGDRVILSSRMIPGNERAIFSMINHLCRREVDVHCQPHGGVHTSGHGHRDEMKEMLQLVRPKFVIPIHGELRHLTAHRDLAVEVGIPRENTLLVEDGNVVEVSEDEIRRAGDCVAGRVFVDGLGVGDISEVVLRDRRHLAQDGMLVVILGVDRQSLEITVGPDIVARGFVFMDGEDDVMDELADVVTDTFNDLPLESREEVSVVDDEIRRALKRHIRKRINRRPMILPVVMEV